MSSESRKIEKELRNISMSLNKFLTLYCGIPNDKLINIKMSHRDIKSSFPNLKRISFESAYKDKKLLAIGRVVIVTDSYGNIGPYLIPDMFSVSQDFELKQSKREENLENVILSEGLSKYELVLLCRYYKKHNRQEEYWIATRLLKKKKDFYKVKKYKKEKFDLIMKGREDCEEF